MDTHVKALGIINIIFGALSAIFASFTLISFRGFPELFAAAEADFTVAALVASVSFHALLAVPCIVLGSLIMRYNDTAKSLLIVVSALNLLNMPLGSLVGGYGLWVLLQPETDPLFIDPPGRRATRKKHGAPAEPQEQAHPKVKGTSILRSRGADAGPH
jgi:hypothetical protein